VEAKRPVSAWNLPSDFGIADHHQGHQTRHPPKGQRSADRLTELRLNLPWLFNTHLVTALICTYFVAFSCSCLFARRSTVGRPFWLDHFNSWMICYIKYSPQSAWASWSPRLRRRTLCNSCTMIPSVVPFRLPQKASKKECFATVSGRSILKAFGHDRQHRRCECNFTTSHDLTSK